MARTTGGFADALRPHRSQRSVSFIRHVEGVLRSQSFDVVHAISPFPIADLYQPRGGTVAETVERNLALRRSGLARSMKRFTNALNMRQRCLLRMEHWSVQHRNR